MQKADYSAFDAKAREIVTLAMNDRDTYETMARKEGEVWGRILPDRAKNAEFVKDQEASQKLRINRNFLGLRGWVKTNKRRFRKGLSLGCGEGRMERPLLKEGICEHVTGIDVADEALAAARSIAAEEGLNAEYQRQDMNFLDLKDQKFDLIVAQTSLHHIVHLENVAEKIYNALTDDGILYIHDYIGENQHQYLEKRMDISNSVIQRLPSQFRYNRIYNRQLGLVARRAPGTLISPFESIRAAEIPGIFKSKFKVVDLHESGSIIHLIVPPGTRAAYAESEVATSLFETIMTFDQTLVDEKVLPPVAGQYIFMR